MTCRARVPRKTLATLLSASLFGFALAASGADAASFGHPASIYPASIYSASIRPASSRPAGGHARDPAFDHHAPDRRHGHRHLAFRRRHTEPGDGG